METTPATPRPGSGSGTGAETGSRSGRGTGPLSGTALRPGTGTGTGPRPGVAPRSLARRLAAPVGTLAAVVAAFAYVGAVDPNEPGHYPVCPLFRLTGVLCPGCGGLRSAHAFIHGDLPTALGANAAAVLGYLVFAAGMVWWLTAAVRARPVRVTITPVWWWATGALLAVFAVVRNLPFGAALAP